MKYSIHLNVYDGPLDLLCDMISKQKIDIKDISIIEITKQYLAYINMLEAMDLEVTSDFITMATKLLEIKSKYLLFSQRELDEEEDPRLELMEQLKEYKKYKKLKHDPRITKLGNILRKTSLDEFPQFVNILKGEMSLVGPRPYLYREKEDLGEYYYNSITKVKPGITGYWQVNGRNDVDFEERAYMDTYYIERRGIVMDLKIILKTFLKIFKKEGAV